MQAGQFWLHRARFVQRLVGLSQKTQIDGAQHGSGPVPDTELAEDGRDLVIKYTFIIPFACAIDSCMGFEYDPEKSAENKRKHGLDFEEAQALWNDAALVEVPARVTDEPRWVVIGKLEEKHWSAVVTRRGENIRLISVRRSRDEEVAIYEGEDEGGDV